MERLSCVANELSPLLLATSQLGFGWFGGWGGASLKLYTLLCYEPEAMPESSLDAKTNNGWM